MIFKRNPAWSSQPAFTICPIFILNVVQTIIERSTPMIAWVISQCKTLSGTSLHNLGESFVSCSGLSMLVSRIAQLNHHTITEFSFVLGLQISKFRNALLYFPFNVMLNGCSLFHYDCLTYNPLLQNSS